MKLYRQTTSSWSWLFGVIRFFLRKRALTTVGVICAFVLSAIAKLLTFFLPLKVILLAGSSGVPGYLPFVDPEHKAEWIVGLTVAAFASYVLMLAMDALARRWSEDASAEIHEEANQLVVVGNQREQAESYYKTFCELCASAVFALLGMAALYVLDLHLALFLTAMFALQFAFSALVMSGPDDINPGRLRRILEENLGSYLSVLTSLNFLTGFLVILTPFVLTGGEGNILIAILSIVILRQVLGNLSDIVKDTVTLTANRQKIDALLFREHQMGTVEHKLQKTLRELFPRPSRYARIRDELEKCGLSSADLRVDWIDPYMRGVSLFDIVTGTQDANGAGEAHYQLQIFAPNMIHQMENEDFLFRSMPRARLKAPALTADFAEGPFECRIYEHGNGEEVAPADWAECYRALLVHYWSCQPPKALIGAFSASHKPLQDRLSDEMAGRMSVAVDTEAEQIRYEAFRARLPAIRDWIRSVPLYVHNPDLGRHTTVRSDDGEIRIMYWGRWTLEPIGAFMPRDTSDKGLTAMLDAVRSERNDVPDTLTPGQLLLMHRCRQFEDEIARERYRAALQLAGTLLEGHTAHVELPTASEPRPRDAVAHS